LKAGGLEKKSVGGAIILAGGDSKRLNQPKALLDFNGQSLIEVMVEILQKLFSRITLVTDCPELYRGLPVEIVGDLFSDRVKSPLRGIYSGLIASSLPHQFVVPCDMPYLNPDLIRHMQTFAAKADAVVPLVGSYYQPLHAFYSRDCIGIIEKQIEAGRYKITDFYAKIKVCYLGKTEIDRFDPQQRSFININTWGDYQLALEQLGDVSSNEINKGGRNVDENT
jgi:molybdopterin-guanine dinucleotide biosynthesis protein A